MAKEYDGPRYAGNTARMLKLRKQDKEHPFKTKTRHHKEVEANKTPAINQQGSKERTKRGRARKRKGRRMPPRKSQNQKDERAKANEQVLSFIFFALQRDVKSCPGLQP